MLTTAAYSHAQTHAPGSYRYAFQGQEVDNELKGKGNSVNFKYRMQDPRLGRFFAVDPLNSKFPWLSPYAFAGNTPLQAIDLEGLEIFYAQSGEKIAIYGTSTEVRVLNEDQLATAITEFATYTQALETNPNASNQFISTTLLTAGSVAFSDYFETVADVTDDAALETYSNNGQNCFAAASAQMTNEGLTQQGPITAKQAVVDNTAAVNNKPNNVSTLTADPFGAAIAIQADLNNGDPVMVGVKETKSNGTVPNPNNRNALTGHFVVIRSANVAANGTITFNYLDNASTSLGKNANNNFTLNTTTGVITDGTVPARSSYTEYQVTEVRDSQ